MSNWSDLGKHLFVEEVDPRFMFSDGICISFLNRFPIAKGSNGELERISAVELVLAGTVSLPIMQFAGVSSGRITAGGKTLYDASEAWLALNSDCCGYPPIIAPKPWWALIVDSNCTIYNNSSAVVEGVVPHSIYRQVFDKHGLSFDYKGARAYLELVDKFVDELDVVELHPVIKVGGSLSDLLRYLDIRYQLSLESTEINALRELYLTTLNPINSSMRDYYRMSAIIGDSLVRAGFARMCIRESPGKYQGLAVEILSNESLHLAMYNHAVLRDALPVTTRKYALSAAFNAVIGALPLRAAEVVLSGELENVVSGRI